MICNNNSHGISAQNNQGLTLQTETPRCLQALPITRRRLLGQTGAPSEGQEVCACRDRPKVQETGGGAEAAAAGADETQEAHFIAEDHSLVQVADFD